MCKHSLEPNHCNVAVAVRMVVHVQKSVFYNLQNTDLFLATSSQHHSSLGASVHCSATVSGASASGRLCCCALLYGHHGTSRLQLVVPGGFQTNVWLLLDRFFTCKLPFLMPKCF